MPALRPIPIVALAGLLTALALGGPAAADGPGYADPAPRYAPRRLAHRPLPPDAYRARGFSPYGGPPVYGPVVRAYLPRNNNVPMYNEPPAR